MDRTELTTIVQQSVFDYAGGGNNIEVFAVANADKTVFAVLIVDSPVHQQDADIVVMARLVDEYVVIEEDTTDYPLLEVLLKRGIPRQQIVLARAGEPIPTGRR
jgi:hypothetical protein